MMKTFMKILLSLVAFCNFAFSSYHSRNYSWFFEYGNFISNWSFENRSHEWENIPGLSESRFDPNLAGFAAVNGRFVARVVGDNSTGSSNLNLMYSDLIPLKSGTTYTLSFYFRADGIVNSIIPAINLNNSLDESSAENQYVGSTTYQNTSSWTLYRMVFASASDEIYARLYLYNALVGASGTVYFDDVILEEGDISESEIIERRKRIVSSVSFADKVGRTHQTQLKLNLGTLGGTTKYRTQSTEFDASSRPYLSTLPYVSNVSTPQFLDNGSTLANQYYVGGENPDARDSAFSEVLYANEPSARVLETGSYGGPWSLTSERPSEYRYFYVDDLSIPLDIENPVVSASDGAYRLDWSLDPEQNYSLSWTNKRGEMVQTAYNIGPVSNPTQIANWQRTRYEFFKTGQLKRLLTPIDVDESGSDYREVSNFNAQGLMVSMYQVDRGLLKNYYNVRGQVRFTQNEEQRVMDEFTYFDYDFKGRLVSVGTQQLTPSQQANIQDLADNNKEGTVGQGNKVERKGFIYDRIKEFEERTGIVIGNIIPGVTFEDGNGRLLAQYHTNADVDYTELTNAEKIVADFFKYDIRERVTEQYKYIGAIHDASKQIQKITYNYDVANRLLSSSLFESPGATTPIHEQFYKYDDLGRIAKVTGMNNKPIASYIYYDRGPLKSVQLGGNSGGTSGILIEYIYHIQGWIQEIKATKVGTGDLVFQQMLGYEAKALADASVPDLFQARYTGIITQNLYKLANSEYPLRLYNYRYDELGRMLEANYQKDSQSTPSNTNQPITAPVTLLDVTDQDSHLEYDLNGRIEKKRSGGVTAANGAVYNYLAGSYKLDNISGQLAPDMERDLSNSMNFDYDSRGAMVEDKSQNLKIDYGWDVMPVKFSIDLESPEKRRIIQYHICDANGQRVSRVTLANKATGIEESIIGIAETGEPDIYDYSNLTFAFAEIQQKIDLLDESEVPFSIKMYVIPMQGSDLVEPADGELVPMLKGTTDIPVEIIGVIKGSSEYQALLDAKTNNLVVSTTHYFGDEREVHEFYDESGAFINDVSITGLFGRNVKVGRILSSGDYEFYVKNTIGSTVKLVDVAGNTTTKDAYDYLSYGELKYVSDNADEVEVTEKFTGKELEKYFSAYYFGARFYDPELGTWLNLDPAAQFFNPYGYGGDPINFVDPDGREVWSIFRPSKWERFGRHSKTWARDHAIDDAQTVLGTAAINTLGLGACYFSKGTVCAVGYYDGRKDEAHIIGGGHLGGFNGYGYYLNISGDGAKGFGGVGGLTGQGTLYAAGGYFNTNTGDVSVFGGAGGIAPFWGGVGEISGNYKTKEFQIRGTGLKGHILIPPSTIYRNRKDGFGFSLNAKKRNPRCGRWHHERNEIGGNYSGYIPSSLNEARGMPELWAEQPEVANSTHGGRGRTVFLGLGENSGKQIVYSAQGNLVTTAGEGTYDYFPPIDESGNKTFWNSIQHTVVDILPWAYCGD